MTRINNFTVPPPQVGLGDTQAPEDVDQLKKVLDDFFKNFWITLGDKQDIQKPGDDQRPNLPPPDPDVGSGDLATLLLKLKMETDEKQLKGAIEFLKTQKQTIKQKTDERIKKIMEAAEQAKKAEKAGKWAEVLGWVGFGLTIAMAAIACIATGGLATGPVVCALMAVGMLILDKTGAMGKIMEGLAKGFEKLFEKAPWLAKIIAAPFKLIGIDLDPKQVAQICAAVTIMLVTILIARGAGGLGKSTETASKLASWATKATEISLDATAVGGATAGAVKGYYDYESLNARADAKEIQKFIVKLQQQLEDEQDRIRELVEQMQANVSVVLDILKSEAQTKQVIARQTMI